MIGRILQPPRLMSKTYAQSFALPHHTEPHINVDPPPVYLRVSGVSVAFRIMQDKSDFLDVFGYVEV